MYPVFLFLLLNVVSSTFFFAVNYRCMATSMNLYKRDDKMRKTLQAIFRRRRPHLRHIFFLENSHYIIGAVKSKYHRRRFVNHRSTIKTKCHLPLATFTTAMIHVDRKVDARYITTRCDKLSYLIQLKSS